MCPTVKTPTPQQPKEKPPVYMRNRYLDGLGIGAEAAGRNSLRIDPGTPPARRPAPVSVTANPVAPTAGFSGLGIGSTSVGTGGRRALNMGLV